MPGRVGYNYSVSLACIISELLKSSAQIYLKTIQQNNSSAFCV